MMDRYNETRDSWDKVARLYEEIFMDLALYDETYDNLCDLLPPEAGVLEIGCGPGNITRYLLRKRTDLKLHAIDNSAEMIALARANNPAASFAVMDCRELDTIHKHYHAVVCGFCLPYLSENDCSKLFGDCCKLLYAGGLLYLSFVPGPPALSGYKTGSSGDRMYFYYHQTTTVQNQLALKGFKEIRSFQIDYPKMDGTSEEHTVMIMQYSIK